MLKTSTNCPEDVYTTCTKICAPLANMFSVDNVVNFELAIPINLEHCQEKSLTNSKELYLRNLQTFENKKYGVRAYAARNWLFIGTCFLFCLNEFFLKDINPIQAPPLLSFVFLGLLTAAYQYFFSSFPFESMGTFFLPKDQKRVCNLEQKFRYSLVQTNRYHPLNPYYPLHSFSKYAIGNKPDLDSFNHLVMLRTLFAAKNNTYDCVSICGVILLKLIEHKIPALIEHFSVSGLNNSFVHHYILVNRAKNTKHNDFNSLNNDSIFIDLWYGLIRKKADIIKDQDFFLKYPLLLPTDKVIHLSIMGDQAPPSYQFYLQELQSILSSSPTHDRSNINKLL